MLFKKEQGDDDDKEMCERQLDNADVAANWSRQKLDLFLLSVRAATMEP